MNKYLVLTMSMCMACIAQAQTEPANYHTVANRLQIFYNSQKADSIFNMFSPKIKVVLPEDKTTQTVTDLNKQMGAIKTTEFLRMDAGHAVYKTSFENGTLNMILSLDENNRVNGWRFMPYAEAATGMVETKSNYIFKSSTGNIYGTLTSPPGDAKVPVVLIIAGSGSTDRNCNATSGLSTNAYHMLADSLLQEGIACVRYDKRGVGESKDALASEETFTFENMVNDAAGFIHMLKTDARFSRVIVLGHSEGALIGTIAAQREHVNAVISLAGAGQRIDKVIERQLATSSGQLSKMAATMMDSLKKGYSVKNVPVDLTKLFRPSIQPYLMSWLKYDPQHEMKNLKCPVLILQGTTDLQVEVADAQLLKKAKPDATLHLISGMNHILKNAPAQRQQNLATYTDPNLPLNAELVRAVVSFAKGNI